MQSKNNTIDRFSNAYYFLSNFYPCSVTYGSYTYQNAEAAFQAQKTYSTKIKQEFTTLSGRDAKKRGRSVQLPSSWEENKETIMKKIVLAKFSQNEDLRKKLLATGDAELIEGNWWGDQYWGGLWRIW